MSDRLDAFGRARSLSHADLVQVRLRLVGAKRAATELASLVQKWRESTMLIRVYVPVPGDDFAVDVKIDSSRAIPADIWGRKVGLALHDARSALDQLNTLMFENFAVGDYDPTRIAFPVSDNGRDWRSWRQASRALPDWATERFEAVQPFRGAYKGLKALAESNDSDKHRRVGNLSLALIGSLGSGGFVLKGVNLPDDVISVEGVGNILSPGTKSVHIMHLRSLVEFESFPSDDELSSADVELRLDSAGFDVDLDEFTDLFARVEHAVEYVASGDTRHLQRYSLRES